MSTKKEFRLDYGGREVVIETGRLAKQADGAVLVSCEGTQVLVTVCSAKEAPEGQDFFPLLVDYKEKFYAAGKFLGGYMKREGRPSDPEILLMRMVDRPLRPLFPEGYMCETVITAQVLSFDPKADPEVLAGIGASASLAVSDIPFAGPLGFCKVGKINGKLVLNPAHDEWEKSTLELVVAATKEAILMVEGESDEISEDDMLEALLFAQDNCARLCDVITRMTNEAGRAKRTFAPILPNQKLMEKVGADFSRQATAALAVNDKLERVSAVAALEKIVADAIKANPTSFGLAEGCNSKKEAHFAIDQVLYKMMRQDILKKKHRIGGRAVNQVRPITSEISVLRSVHGSSLFTRGETQVLAAVTMGGKDGEQMRDRLHGLDLSRFYLHYMFAGFSVGEAKGYRGVGRREVGHGNLAERALKKVLPSQADFPYCLRVNCEVLESNGSSSMASVCSGSMALMDAGVPLKGQVAGVAMGLIKEGSDYVVLTDILGDEDHLGDMDFKVAGTNKGITAIQMDIKITGISKEIFHEAMASARVARMHILSEMNKTIAGHRQELKEGVPRINTFKIEPDQIGALIGPGGKNIRKIQETYLVSLEINEDGTVLCVGRDEKKMAECLDHVNLMLNGPKIGTDYEGLVVSTKEYGAFVDIGPGISGLLHVSELTEERVRDVCDYLSEGDTISVRVVDVDRFGKIKLSAKAIRPLTRKPDTQGRN